MRTTTATLHDNSEISIEVSGTGPAVLLPVNPAPLEGKEADEKQLWGVDPALGRHLIDGLNDRFTVIAFDYEGHRMAHPAPRTLFPGNITKDFLAVADAAGVERFAYYGYSWLALCGLQLGIHAPHRLSALIMGAYPPIDGPYNELLAVTRATYALVKDPQAYPPAEKTGDGYDWDSYELTLSVEQTQQFFTLYAVLQGFNDRNVQAALTCPRLCFVGSDDKQEYSERWGGVTVDMATPLLTNAEELKSLGWDVQVLEGLNHISAMQPTNVLPVLRPWLLSQQTRRE